jgi:hypothetical protein
VRRARRSIRWVAGEPCHGPSLDFGICQYGLCVAWLYPAGEAAGFFRPSIHLSLAWCVAALAGFTIGEIQLAASFLAPFIPIQILCVLQVIERRVVVECCHTLAEVEFLELFRVVLRAGKTRAFRVGECCRGRLEGFRACSFKRTLARQASAGGNDRKFCVAGVFAVRRQFSTWCVRAGPHCAYWFMPTAELCPTAMERRAVSAYLRAIERASLRHHRGEGEAQACS